MDTVWEDDPRGMKRARYSGSLDGRLSGKRHTRKPMFEKPKGGKGKDTGDRRKGKGYGGKGDWGKAPRGSKPVYWS